MPPIIQGAFTFRLKFSIANEMRRVSCELHDERHGSADGSLEIRQPLSPPSGTLSRSGPSRRRRRYCRAVTTASSGVAPASVGPLVDVLSGSRRGPWPSLAANWSAREPVARCRTPPMEMRGRQRWSDCGTPWEPEPDTWSWPQKACQ